MENNDVRFRKIDERMDRTDRLVDALHEEMVVLTGNMAALVDAQIRTQAQLVRNEQAFATITELAKSMDERINERIDRSDRLLDALPNPMSIVPSRSSGKLRVSTAAVATNAPTTPIE